MTISHRRPPLAVRVGPAFSRRRYAATGRSQPSLPAVPPQPRAIVSCNPAECWQSSRSSIVEPRVAPGEMDWLPHLEGTTAVDQPIQTSPEQQMAVHAFHTLQPEQDVGALWHEYTWPVSIPRLVSRASNQETPMPSLAGLDPFPDLDTTYPPAHAPASETLSPLDLAVKNGSSNIDVLSPRASVSEVSRSQSPRAPSTAAERPAVLDAETQTTHTTADAGTQTSVTHSSLDRRRTKKLSCQRCAKQKVKCDRGDAKQLIPWEKRHVGPCTGMSSTQTLSII